MISSRPLSPKLDNNTEEETRAHDLYNLYRNDSPMFPFQCICEDYNNNMFKPQPDGLVYSYVVNITACIKKHKTIAPGNVELLRNLFS